jgi:hypothetical protein
VRIVGTQRRIQSGRVPGTAGQHSRGLDGENDSLSTTDQQRFLTTFPCTIIL